MRSILVILFLIATSCSSPSRQCESQFDCFGSEVCLDGECVMQIVVTDDTSTANNVSDIGNPGDAGNTTDTRANHSTSDGGPNLPDPPDMEIADAGACSPRCDDDEVCSGFGECVAASTNTVWTLDDVEVARHHTAEGHYFVAFDSLYLAIPYWGRNLTLTVADVSTTQPFSATCADFQDTGFALSLITTDNGWADLEALPARWSGLIVSDSSCPDGLADGDTLERWEFEITTLSPTSVTGTVDIEIAGAGPRAGETLRITSSFDVELEEM